MILTNNDNKIIYKSEFWKTLAVIQLLGIPFAVLLIRKMIVEDDKSILLWLILAGFVFSWLHLLWMFFGTYELIFEKTILYVKKKLFFTFYSKNYHLAKIEELEHVRNHAYWYGWSWGGLSFPLMFENAIGFTYLKKKVILYLPNKECYEILKSKIGLLQNCPAGASKTNR